MALVGAGQRLSPAKQSLIVEHYNKTATEISVSHHNDTEKMNKI